MKFIEVFPIVIRASIAFTLAALLAFHGLKKKSLDQTGAAAAFFVGFVAFAVSYRMGMILILFYRHQINIYYFYNCYLSNMNHHYFFFLYIVNLNKFYHLYIDHYSNMFGINLQHQKYFYLPYFHQTYISYLYHIHF